MKGRKTCPECQESVGARTKECECGHLFLQPLVSKPKKRRKKKKKSKPKPKVSTDTRVKTCLKCGEENKFRAKRCESCDIAFGSHEYKDLRNQKLKDKLEKKRKLENFDKEANDYAQSLGYEGMCITFASKNEPTYKGDLKQKAVSQWISDNLLDEQNRLRYYPIFIRALVQRGVSYSQAKKLVKRWYEDTQKKAVL